MLCSPRSVYGPQSLEKKVALRMFMDGQPFHRRPEQRAGRWRSRKRFRADSLPVATTASADAAGACFGSIAQSASPTGEELTADVVLAGEDAENEPAADNDGSDEDYYEPPPVSDAFLCDTFWNSQALWSVVMMSGSRKLTRLRYDSVRRFAGSAVKEVLSDAVPDEADSAHHLLTSTSYALPTYESCCTDVGDRRSTASFKICWSLAAF